MGPARLVTTIKELSILIKPVLDQKDATIVTYFLGKRRTVAQASEELGIPYQTLIRHARKLQKAGFLIETGFRENNKRFLTAVKSPTESPSFDPRARIFFNGEVLTIQEALNKFAVEPEVPIRQEIITLLASLVYRAAAISEGEPHPGGMNPLEVRVIVQQIQAKITLWVAFCDALLEQGTIWIDDKDNGKRIGIDIPDAGKHIAEVTRRYMGENKGPLER